MRDRAALAAVLLLAASGCGRCARPAAAPPERLLPADVAWAVVVPRLRVAQEQAVAAARTAAAFPAAAELPEALAAARAQLGLDPLDALALRTAGVDPERGLAAAGTADGKLVLVLPVADEGKLEETVARLARDRLGAAERARRSERGVAVTSFRRAGQPAALSVASAQGNALLAAGPDAPARLASLAGLAPPASLEASAAFAAARARLGADPALLAFVPPGSAALARWATLREGVAVGVSAGATRLAASALLLLAPDRRAAWRSALAPPASDAAGAAALPPMPPGAALVARLAGEPAPLLRRLLAASPAARAALARARLDPEQDLLAPLGPGAALALSLAPTFEVAAVSRGGGGALLDDPFRLVHLSAALSVRDEAGARAALDRLVRAAPALGLAAAARAEGGHPAWRFARGRTALEVALDGRRLLVAGGPGGLERLLAGGAAYQPPGDDARAALAPGGSGAVLDFGRLVAAFRALPPGAYGTGPDAFVMRSLADRVIDPAARLVAATARARAVEEGVRVDVALEARAPEAAP